jgi:hypothetical protein
MSNLLHYFFSLAVLSLFCNNLVETHLKFMHTSNQIGTVSSKARVSAPEPMLILFYLASSLSGAIKILYFRCHIKFSIATILPPKVP